MQAFKKHSYDYSECVSISSDSTLNLVRPLIKFRKFLLYSDIHHASGWITVGNE